MARATHSSNASPIKRLSRAVGAGVISVGLVGVFAFPAYATIPEPEGQPDGFAAAQSIVAADADAAIPAGEVSAQLIRVAAPAGVPVQRTIARLKDIPAGHGAQGLVAAALAQVGINQDCTDLVQNSLAAIGMTVSRLKGGPDLGVHSFPAFGREVTNGAYAPGDILVWGNQHAAIYIGNGKAVHGGYGGNHTVIASYASPNDHPRVFRVG